jgi:ribosomal protein S12 methylthiotransferase accessory factor YcaO
LEDRLGESVREFFKEKVTFEKCKEGNKATETQRNDQDIIADVCREGIVEDTLHITLTEMKFGSSCVRIIINPCNKTLTTCLQRSAVMWP